MKKLLLVVLCISSFYSFAELKKFQCLDVNLNAPYNVQLATFPNQPNKLLAAPLDPANKKNYKVNSSVETYARGLITVQANGSITGNASENREAEYERIIFKSCVAANFPALIEGEDVNIILEGVASKYVCENNYGGIKNSALVQISKKTISGNPQKLNILHYTVALTTKSSPYQYQQGYTYRPRGEFLEIDESTGIIVLHNGDARFSSARFTKCVKADFKNFF